MRKLGELGQTDQPYWDRAPGNINFEYFSSESPVDMFPSCNTGNTTFIYTLQK